MSENDRERIETYLAHAVADAAAPQGRFTQQSLAHVTGAAPSAPLPAPAWSHDPVPQEPPLGIAINDAPDLGEPIAPPEEER